MDSGFTFQIDNTKLVAALDEKSQKQIPWMMILALKSLGYGAQAAQRDYMSTHMNIRRNWVLQAIKILPDDKPTKQIQSITISVQPEALYILDRLERGLEHHPYNGRKYLWWPNEAVFGNKIISAANPLSPQSLKFRREGNRMVGNNHTFMVTAQSGIPLVLQRTDRSSAGAAQPIGQGPVMKGGKSTKKVRRGGVRLLYILITKAAPVTKLHFYDNCTMYTTANMDSAMSAAYAKAMETAK